MRCVHELPESTRKNASEEPALSALANVAGMCGGVAN